MSKKEKRPDASRSAARTNRADEIANHPIPIVTRGTPRGKRKTSIKIVEPSLFGGFVWTVIMGMGFALVAELILVIG